MTTLPPRLQELLDELRLIPDVSERSDFLIDCADRFVEVAPNIATRPFSEAHRVPGCESEAFVWATPREDGTLDFHFAVENPQGISAKAFAVMLGDTLSGAPAEQICSVPRELVYDIFGRGIGMGKGQGLMGMLFMVQSLARASGANAPVRRESQ